MARAIRKFHVREIRNKYGWAVISKPQTQTRLALCREALCGNSRSLRLKFKRCYDSDLVIQKHARLKFTSTEDFQSTYEDIDQYGWGGEYMKIETALEGAFYPFVRVRGGTPIDCGAIWIGTFHDFPKIYVDNLVANWLCPYTKSGLVVTEPFEPLARVLENWNRLANSTLFPALELEPVAPI